VSFDNVCKLLAEKYPADFVRWLITEDSTDIKVLKNELSIEPIRADWVVFLQTANRILQIEFQTCTQSKPGIPFRMLLLPISQTSPCYKLDKLFIHDF
jgi:predicted transposase YdaD